MNLVCCISIKSDITKKTKHFVADIKLKGVHVHLTGFKNPTLITISENKIVPDLPHHIQFYSSTLRAQPTLKMNDQVINRFMAAALIKIKTAFGATYNF